MACSIMQGRLLLDVDYENCAKFIIYTIFLRNFYLLSTIPSQVLSLYIYRF